MSRRDSRARTVFLDAPRADSGRANGVTAKRSRGWLRAMPATAFIGALLVAFSTLTFPTSVAHAFEVPTATPATGTVVTNSGARQNVQTQASGLVITYQALDGSIAGKLIPEAPIAATSGNAGGSPALSTTTLVGQFGLEGPSSSTERSTAGCVSTSSPTRMNCDSLAKLRITFSQPVNDPIIYLGRIGGTTSWGDGLWTEGRLTASTAASGVTLAGLDNTGGNSNLLLSSNSWTVSDSVTGSSEFGYECNTSNPGGCASFTAVGVGITSLTFDLDWNVTYTTSGGRDLFSVAVATQQQFSTAPTSYNGSAGNSAPFHIPGGLKFGTAINAASLSTTQNTTASPVAKTTPAAVNSGTGAGDGLATLPPLVATTANQTITIPVAGVTKAATVAGWIDWNRNGVFDASERVSTTIAAGASTATLTVAAPSGTSAGQFYSRFRVAYTASEVTNPTGAATSGEVEDYAIALKPTIAVSNSASSSAGAFDLKVSNSGGTVTTVRSASAPGDSSGVRTVYNNSTYGAPHITVAQNPTTAAVPLTVSQTQTSLGTYKVSYVCVNGAGALSSGTLPNSIQGSTSTIPTVSLPGSSTSGTTVLQQAISCTFTNVLISIDAIDDSISVAQNTATSPATNVLGNDTASNTTADPTKVTIVTQPLHGTVVVNSTTGAVTYTPATNYSGADSYRYRVCDVSSSNGVCDTATVTVAVGLNAVTATADSASTTPGVAVTTNVLANDTISAGGAPLDKTNVIVSTAAAHGTTAVNGTTGAVTYTPAAGFSGTDTYSYTVCDTSTPTAVCKTAQVTVQVPNQFTPGPGLGSLTTPQNSPITTTLPNLVSTTGAAIDPTKVTQAVAPANGTLSINPTTGNVTYQPAAGFTGTDSYSVNVCDKSLPTSVCTTIVVTVQVGANTVVTSPDSATTALGTAVTLAVLSNDSTMAGGAPLNAGSVTVTAAPANGSTTVNSSTGAVTYTPTGNFTGQDTFTYRVCDTSTPTPICGTAVGTVTVENVFTPGVAATGVATSQNTPVTSPLASIATTSGASLDPTKVTQVSAPTNGSLSINPTTGAVTYTPSPGYTGPDSYDISVCDTSVPSQCSTVTIPVTVGANVVTANADSGSTSVETPVAIAVLGNDTVSTNGAALDPASVSVTIAPSDGATAVNASTGAVTYTPASGFSGVDTFTYEVCDTSTPTALCDSAVVTVTVDNVFTPGVDASGITTAQNQPITSPLASIATTTGSALDPTTVTQASAPSNGTLSINATTGAVTYTPVSGYTGPDSYDITVCDVSAPSQCSTVTIPVTVGANVVTAQPDAESTTVETPIAVQILTNDTVSTGGAPLDPSSVSVTSAPSNGSTAVNTSTGAITYTPAAGFSGQDTFTYEVCDTSTPTALCDTALVTITVDNVFTPGVDASGISTPQNQPIASPLASIATTTGADLDPTKVTQSSAPSNGTLSINASTGAVTYTPTAGYTGPDSYDVTVCDESVPSQCSTVTIPVTVGANVVTADADSASTAVATPVAVPVLSNDSVAAGGAPLAPSSVTITGAASNGATSVNTTTGAVTYTPTAGFSGQDTFTYEVCDTSTPTALCDTALVTVTVDNVFTPGVAASGVTTGQNQPITSPLASIATTSGADLDPSKVTQASAPTNGSISIDPSTGDVTYTPLAGYTGPDSYEVTVCDESVPSQCSTITIPVTVGANVVSAEPDAETTSVDTDVAVAVLNNDTVPAGGAALDPTSVSVTVAPAHGSTAVNATSGVVTYAPAVGFSGQDTFTYEVCDTSTPTALCDTALVTVTVDNVFTPGVDASGVSTPQNQPITSPLASIATTTGADLDPTKVTQSSAPSNGTLSINASTGAVTYTPTAGYTGPDSYDVTVCDESVPSQCSTVTIPVTVGANVVTADADSASTTVATAVTVPVLGNDTVTSGGAPLDPSSVSVTAAASNGATAVNTTSGAITYTPTAGFSGQDTFTYEVCDTSTPTALCDTALVTITVDNVFTPGVDASGISTPQNQAITSPLASIVTATGAALDPTLVSEASAPANGAIAINATTGAVTYTPNTGYTGADEYDVTVCDQSVPSQCSTVTIPVTVGANVVTARPDSESTGVATAVTVAVLDNDTVPSGGAALDPSSVKVTTAPTNGATSVNATTGAVTYTPAAGFSGKDTFTYEVCDTSTPTALCDTTLVTITVDNGFAPGVHASGITTPQNQPITSPLASIATTTGAALDPTKVTQSSAPSNGTLSINATTGAVTYTPIAGYTGPDSYDVTVCDLSVPAQCSTVTIPVTVGANVVTARPDSETTNVETAVSVPVLDNDSVPAGGAALDPSSVTVTVAPANGATAVNTTTGAVSYTPVAGFSGQDTFTYEVCDTSTPTALCETAVATITVDNEFVAGSGGVSTPQNTAVVTPLAAIVTTTGADVDPTKVSQNSAPSHGSIAIDPSTGAVTYTPSSGYTGADSYDLDVCDVSVPSQCSIVTVPVTVGANAVDAQADSASTSAVTAVDVPVLANDTISAGGAPLNPGSVTVPVAAAHGSTVVNTATGQVAYTPAAGFSGTDTFTYRVCDTTNPTPVCDTAVATITVNNDFTDGPAAAGISTLQNTDVETPLVDIVTATGLPVDGTSVTETTAPTHGSIAIDPSTGAVTYTPALDYSGPDSYEVTVCDTAATPECTTVTVTVTVGVNAVTARADSDTTSAITPVTTALLSNDSVAGAGATLNPASVTVTTAPAHGSTSVNLTTGGVEYTPAAGFSGTDTYTYRVCDTSVPTPVCGSAVTTVTVTNVFVPGSGAGGAAPGAIITGHNALITVPSSSIISTRGLPIDPATLALETGSGPTNGSIAIDLVTGHTTFTPTAGFAGLDSFVLTFCDTGSPAACSRATVPVTVGANIVTAQPDSAKVGMGDRARIALLSNDVSASGQPLDPSSVRLETMPKNGVVTVNAVSGEIEYIPTAGWMGVDKFSYSVCDTSYAVPVCATADVQLTTLPAALAYTGGTVIIGLQIALASLLGGIVLLLIKRRNLNREADRSAQGE